MAGGALGDGRPFQNIINVKGGPKPMRSDPNVLRFGFTLSKLWLGAPWGVSALLGYRWPQTANLFTTA